MSYPYKAQLEIMGVERVRKGMRAFDVPSRCTYETCFLGTACGDFGADALSNLLATRSFFAGRGDPGTMFTLSHGYELDRETLHQSCMLYLAENGSAVEPPVPEGSVV